jgi:Rad3-related DNA helicase
MNKDKVNAVVILNEAHTLSKQQEKLLTEKYNWELYPVPKTGWSLDQMYRELESLREVLRRKDTVIFVSPVPFLLKALAFYEGEHYANGAYEVGSVRIMMREARNKEEVQEGLITTTVSQEDWLLA